MQIICLGTASCYPTASRSVSCTAIRFEDGSVWIFDCGEGSQVQLQKSSIRPSRITKIFITHMHGDHVFGLPGLMCTLGTLMPGRNDFTLEMYGPQGLRKFVRDTLILSRSALTYKFVVHELIPVAEQYPEDWNTWPADNLITGSLHPQEVQGKDISASFGHMWNVYDGESASVKAGPVMHTIPSFGFVVTERDEPGKLDAEHLKELGVPPGPLFARVKKGEAITLPCGEILDPLDVLGPPKRGRRVTILGDTSDSSEMVDLAQSSDVVLHEATLGNCMEEKAIEVGHSTPKMAAQYAERVGARVLMLYHFSQRYKTVPLNDTDLCVDVLLKEAQDELAIRDCPCTVMLAKDLLEFTIPRPNS